jgi:hypothetical protein
MMTEYKRIVAACPMSPTASAPAIFFFDSSPSSVDSSYRSYPRIALYDGGGKGFFFMIPNPIQKTKARSGMAQKNDFFYNHPSKLKCRYADIKFPTFFAIKAGRSQE